MKITQQTLELQNRALKIRLQNFPHEIEFDYLEETEVITLTGKNCTLDCAHCGGHYLVGMKTVDEVSQGSTNGSTNGKRSCLISGGCNSQGKVPFLHQLSFIKELKRGRRLNFHVGLVNETEADNLRGLADVVSFDFVGDDDTIQEVYGLECRVEDYLKSYRLLRNRVKVLPHICIGLKGGEFSGEYRALDILEKEGIDGLVFIVFVPTPGTRYAQKSPPSLEKVIRFLAEARLRFPNKPIYLGCMRPKGRYRQELDLAAVRCGVNKIVIPTKAAVELAKELGLKVRRGEECCVL